MVHTKRRHVGIFVYTQQQQNKGVRGGVGGAVAVLFIGHYYCSPVECLPFLFFCPCFLLFFCVAFTTVFSIFSRSDTFPVSVSSCNNNQQHAELFRNKSMFFSCTHCFSNGETEVSKMGDKSCRRW